MPKVSNIVKLDLRGDICPVPLMKTMDVMKTIGEGQSIEVLTDHSPALLTIPNQAIKMKWDVSIQRKGDSLWTISLTRSPVR